MGRPGRYWSTLIQAGTFSWIYPNGQHDYRFFWEIVRTDHDTGGVVPVNTPAGNPGHTMYADIWWTTSGNYGTAHFYLKDVTTGQAGSYSVSNILNWSGVTSSADWIVERPLVDLNPNGYYYYPRPYVSGLGYDHVYWTDVQCGQYGGSFWYPDPGAASLRYYKLYNTVNPDTDLIQGVSTIDYDGDFQTNWYGYGQRMSQ